MLHSTRIPVAAAFGAAALAAATTPAHADTYIQGSRCETESVLFTLGSYHKGDRGYKVPAENPAYNKKDPQSTPGQRPYVAAFQKYNEINPGVVFGFHCPNSLPLFKHVRLGYIDRNSFGRNAFLIGFENAVYDGPYARLGVMTGIMPKGYTKPMPVIGITLEGKGPFAFKGHGYDVRPFAMTMPVGILSRDDDRSKAIYVFGLKATFD